MLLENLILGIRQWLRVPPGASLRKAGQVSTSGGTQVETADVDYVKKMVEITVDDVCRGENPLSINYITETPQDVIVHFDNITEEFNSIVRWVAHDLLTIGLSVYVPHINKKTNRLVILPLNDEVEVYLTKEKEIKVYTLEGYEKKQVKDAIVYLNYDKTTLLKVEDNDHNAPSDAAFLITPKPIQLDAADQAASQVQSSENSIAQFRALISRPARWVNVDIGATQGTKQDEVIDSISSAINANSSSLGQTSSNLGYDDNIPVVPNRKGLGKPEIEESIPNVNIKDMADVDHFISKLCLMMRFPGTYLDFTKELGDTAVSLIRGDLRYAKMVFACQTVIEKTNNAWVNGSEKFAQYEPVMSLTKIPNSEDEDVTDALGNFVELASKIEEFIASDTREEMLHKLEVLQTLFFTSTTSPKLQRWFEEYRNYIVNNKNLDANDVDGTGGGGELPSAEAPTDVENSSDLEPAGEDEIIPDVETFEPASS